MTDGVSSANVGSPRWSARLAAVLVVFVMISTAFVAMTARAEDVPPAIWTGMDEYSPGDVVDIYGEGWAKWVPVSILIEHPDLESELFVVTPDLYGRFVCNDYVAEELAFNPQMPVNVTATQIVEGVEYVAFTQFMDPAAYIEGWTLRPHAKFTTGDVKGYLEGDSVPMIVVLNKRQLGNPDVVTITIGVDFIDTTPLHVPTYGIDYLTQYWDPTPNPPFNTYTNSSAPFWIDPSQGSISSQQRLANIYDAGKHLTVQVWEFTMSFAPAAKVATVRFGAHLAITEPDKPGASYYPGESLHVRMVDMIPDKDEGNRDVPISLDQVECQPEMDLEKIGEPYYVSEGDIITFTVHFSNAGGCPATCVNLWDILEPAAEIIPGTFLYWDDSTPPMTPIPGPVLNANGWTWYIGWFPAAISDSDPFDAYLSFQAEVVTNVPGIYYNDVWMDYSDLNNGDYPTLWDDAPFEILGPPEIEIEKSGPYYAHIGDVITYTYVVTNTGPVDLWDVYLWDDHAGVYYIGFLASGASVTVSLTYEVQEADAHWLVNYVDVYGWDCWGRTAWDWDWWEVEILTPMITISKAVDPECAEIGETVWYSIYVENPAVSETTLYDVEVSDPMLGSWDVGTLLPGQSWSTVIPYEIPASAEWVDILVNTATAMGEDFLGMQVSASDSAAVDVLHPDILVDKWELHGWNCAAAGDTLTYYVDVTNPSWDTVMLVDVYDTMFGWLWSGALGAGQSIQLGPYFYTVGSQEADPLINYAWANAWDYQGHYAYSEDSWWVDILHGMVSVDKWEAHGWECAAAGDTLEYWIEVSNPSWDTSEYVEVYDTMFGWVWSGWLAPGESYLIGPMFYTVTELTPDPLENEVWVDAWDIQGHYNFAWDSWWVDIYHPMIEIVKYEESLWQCAAIGDELWYVIEVWNPSLDTPMYVEVYDLMFSLAPLYVGVLGPGDWVQISGLWYIVDEFTPDPLINTAFVLAEDPQEHSVYAESTWWIDILHPNIWLNKWEANGWECAAAGDTLQYFIEVGVADGDTDMYAEVYDWMFGGLLWSGWIAEGTSVVLGPYSVLVDDETRDPLENWAYVYAWDSQDHFAYAEDFWWVDILHPRIYMYKWSDMTCAHDGELISYYFYIENPSWDTDMYVELYDPMLGVGALWTGTIWAMDYAYLGPYYYTVPVGSEWIENTAFVLAWDYQGHMVYSESSWTYEILHPALDVEKTGPDYAAPGDTITYTVVVTNIGDTDLFDVQVDDSLVGMIGSVATLAIGASVTFTYTYMVPDGEGDVVNVVHAWGWDRQDVMAEDRDTWTVTKLVKVWGYKGGDYNRNGVFNFGEPALENWVIELSGIADDGEIILPRTVLTNDFGYYEFTNLKPGTYTVREILQDGWNVYSAESYDLVLSSGVNAEDVNFMNLPEGSICGYKWHDFNADGFWDASEPVIEGWGIYVWGFDVNGDEVYLSTVTDSNGYYCFLDMIPGDYWVYEETRDGWIPTTLPSVPVDVSGPPLAPFEVMVVFGNVHLGSISGYKWLDLDMDGVRDDPIEPMLPGWTITLTGVLLDGTPVGPIVAITDEFGYYMFDGLLPGTYWVTETVPLGWTHITPDTYEVTLTPGYEFTCGKFGNIEWASICGWKFLDWDMQGDKDGDEPGLEGWAFTLTGYIDNGVDIGGLDPWDTPIDPITVFTDEWGVWCFTNLYPGFYWVTEESRPLWYATTPTVQDFEITSGSYVREIKFGNVPYTCLWGYKFEDKNGDGLWSDDESGLPGWTIVVEGWQNDGVYVYLELTTDEWGYWATCYNILPGEYWIYEIQQEGWMITLPMQGGYYIDLPCVAGPADYWFLFGNFKLGMIFGYKYEDVNGNGVLDDGDRPVQGWLIWLLLPWGEWTWTYTDENGYWEFTGLPAGDYLVEEELGYIGWTPTSPTWYDVDMSSGGIHGPYIFLNTRYGMVYGWKWNDLDSDGIWDINEPGIEGWHIYMIWDGDPTVLETVTDEFGYFEFTGLLPAVGCVIFEEERDGWTPTTPIGYNFDIESGDALMFTFGNFENVCIEVFKFNDLFGDGWYDPWFGDYGLEGWTFQLYQIWEDEFGIMVYEPIDTQVTDEDGYACFEIDHAGTYRVVELGQLGWCPTTPTEQEAWVISGWAWPPYLEFGNFQCVDLTFFKYEDVDSDGVYTEGVDEPLEGWTFWVYDYYWGVWTELTTDEDGLATMHFCGYAYLFIEEEMPDGWCVVTPEWGYYYVEVMSGIALDLTMQFPTERYFYEFGNFECVEVTVFKFWDTCSNGWFDPDLGDVPIEGWYIMVTDSQFNLVLEGYTDEYGYFNFTLCEAGLYYVFEEWRDGWVWIKPGLGYYVIEVDSGDDVYLEFANYEIVEVPIFKYEDVNGNGEYDNGDVPIEGWYFTLVRNDGLVSYDGYTDEDGMLVLEVSASGIYTLTEEDREGWCHVNPASGMMLITVTSGVEVPLLMFGNFQCVDIWVFKFADAYADGQYCPGEGDLPVEGWAFYLWLETPIGWLLVDIQYTDASGYAHFHVCVAGHYQVVEEYRDGWWWILPSYGYYDINVESGSDLPVYMFANFKMGMIYGHKWNDVNGNGEYDEGIDTPLAGWHIQFQSLWFGLYGETWTDENGYYQFTGLPPGYYVVWEESPEAGWIATSDDSVYLYVWGNSVNEVNFLNFKEGCIDGYKWEDLDGDGVYDDEEEEPIEGWLIWLLLPSGEWTWTYTDENGHYQFCHLGPGTYVVEEAQYVGWEPTSPSSVTLDLTSGGMPRVDFLNFQLGWICGWKWNDLNGNGIWEMGEPGIEGWTIYMIRDANPTVYTTVTDEFGFWCFGGLWHDYYVIWEEERDGWCPTTPTDALVWIWSGWQVSVAPFGNFECVDIPIFKYEDVNGNGVYDGDDRPLGNWEFTLYDETGAPVATGETDEFGMLVFTVCRGGWFMVVESDEAGWIHTTPASMEVYVESGYRINTLVFGNFNLGVIWGYKVYDTNLNAYQDIGEIGLEQWVIGLWRWEINQWVPVATTITGGDGSYMFSGLTAGLYLVEEITQPGWVPVGSQAVVVPIVSGSRERVDFFNALWGHICGYKFYDKNLDAVMDEDEPGLEGWTIVLEGYTAQGVWVQMEDETDEDGWYCFTVQPGIYSITEILPSGEWYATTELPVEVNVNDATTEFFVQVDIGNIRYACIYGWKFLDTYAQYYPFWPNGIFDDDEFGLGNWKITLQGWTDTGVWVDLVQYTENEDGNTGYYEFCGLLPGMYWVNETLQYGYYATRPIANLVMVYPFPWGPVTQRIDFGNLLPSRDPEVRFVLAKGVNLWSSPLNIDGGLTASGLATAIGPNCLKVSKLDLATGRYVSYIPGLPTTNFAIELGVGYFVVAKEFTSFTLKGEFAVRTSVGLAQGVNIVGYTSMEPTTASALAALITDCRVYKVSYLDQDTGRYLSFIPSVHKPGSVYDFTVTQGRAYFVVTAASGTLSITV